MPRNRPATEQRLLQAVRSILEESGFAHLGINAIAERAGVDKVLIYRYFGGVPGLLAAVGEEEYFPQDEELAELLQSPANSQPGPIGDRALDFYLRWVEHRPILRQLFLWENVATPNPLIREFQIHRKVFEERLLPHVAPALTAAWEQWFAGNSRAQATGLSVFILGWLHFRRIQETDFHQTAVTFTPAGNIQELGGPPSPEMPAPNKRRRSDKGRVDKQATEVSAAAFRHEEKLPDVLL